MGHALEEAYRVLTVGGTLVDLRPNFPAHEGNRRRARQQVHCVGNDQEIPVGTLRRKLSGFRFTDRMVAGMVRKGVFALKTRKTFRFRYYHRNLSSFYKFMSIRWDNAIMTASDRRRLEQTIQDRPDLQVRVETPMQLNVLRKQEKS